MSQHDQYREIFRERFGIQTWIPTWRPGADLRLGMAGHITEGEFVYEYDVADRGVKLPKRPDPDTHEDHYEWVSESGVSISVKAAGESNQAFKGVASADVGFKLDFRDESSMAIVYRDALEHRIGDERALAHEMVESWNGGPWPKMQIGDVVITQLLVARWGLAFGGSSSGGSVVIKADASLGAPGATIGDIQGKVGVAWQQATSFSALSADGMVVFGWRGLELRQRGLFFKRTVAEPLYKGLVEDDPVLAVEDFPAPWNEVA